MNDVSRRAHSQRGASLIEAATATDLTGMLALLDAAALPTEGVADHLATALVARDGTRVVATAVIEPYGCAALLRSVAVAPEHRGNGLGRRIAQAALDLARTRAAHAAYLVTTTASEFFARHLGFRAIARADVPDVVRACAELTRLCPDSAHTMVCELGPATVVFACVHNAGRSQMAAAFFDLLADARKARATSAGTEPADRVHPEVVTVMREIGVDLGRTTPQGLSEALAAGATMLVTMGCDERCPLVLGVRRIDWAIADPKGQSLDCVRAIRDDVRSHVERLVAAERWQRP